MFRNSPGRSRAQELNMPLLPKPSKEHLTTLENIVVTLNTEIKNNFPSHQFALVDKKQIQTTIDKIIGNPKDPGLLENLQDTTETVAELKKNLYESKTDDMTSGDKQTDAINLKIKLLYENYNSLLSATQKANEYLNKIKDHHKLTEICAQFKTIVTVIEECHSRYESTEERLLAISTPTSTSRGLSGA